MALAPGAKNNPASQESAAPSPEVANPAAQASTGPKKCYSLPWSKLLARVFKQDITRCRKCGGSVKITDAILDPDAIRRILTSLHLPTEIPKFYPPSRAPPMGETDEFQQMDLTWDFGA